LRAKTFRTTAYLERKLTKGQQHADESGNISKRGTYMFRKFSVYGETGTVKSEFSRDGNHIRHSLFMVATPKYHVSFDDVERLSSASGRQ